MAFYGWEKMKFSADSLIIYTDRGYRRIATNVWFYRGQALWKEISLKSKSNKKQGHVQYFRVEMRFPFPYIELASKMIKVFIKQKTQILITLILISECFAFSDTVCIFSDFVEWVSLERKKRKHVTNVYHFSFESDWSLPILSTFGQCVG